MFGFIDKWLEKKLKKSLHIKRADIINKSIEAFKAHHPHADLITLRKQLEDEADRIYTILDRSILRERIKRAKYTFWATAITSAILVGALGAFTSGAILPFITPLITAFITWAVSLATIPVSYNQRIKGAMDSISLVYEKELHSADFKKTEIMLSPHSIINEIHATPLAFSPSTKNLEVKNARGTVLGDSSKSSIISLFHPPAIELQKINQAENITNQIKCKKR